MPRPETQFAPLRSAHGPIIALIYILATSAILAFVPPSAEDVIAPIPQALSRGLASLWPHAHRSASGSAVSPDLLFGHLLRLFHREHAAADGRGMGPSSARWFSRLHPRYKTPINSVLFLGAATLVVALAALIGVGQQESYDLLLTWSFTFYGIAYLALFAIPIFSSEDTGLRPRAVGAPGGGIGLARDSAVRGAVGFSRDRRRQFLAVFAEDRGCGSGSESSGMDDLSGGSGEERSYR